MTTTQTTSDAHTAIAVPSGRKAGLPAHLRPLTPKQKRERLEAALDRLLDAAQAIVDDLDSLDGEPDLEPSAGSTAPGLYSDGWSGSPLAVRRYGRKLLDIDDAEHDGREPPEDDEHTLGWSEAEGQLGCFAAPMDDLERSLGSTHHIDQRRAWTGKDTRDLEEQCEDEGHDSDTEQCQTEDQS